MVYLAAVPNGNQSIFFGILLGISVLGYSLARVCAYLSPDPLSGLVLFSVLVSFQIILCGFLAIQEDVDGYLSWIIYTPFARWSVGQMIYNAFNDYKGSEGDIVLDYYGYSDMNISTTCLIIAAYFVVMETIVLLIMKAGRSTIKNLDYGDPLCDKLAKACSSTSAVPVGDDSISSARVSIKSSMELCHNDTTDLKEPIFNRPSAAAIPLYYHSPRLSRSSNRLTSYRSDGADDEISNNPKYIDSSRLSDATNIRFSLIERYDAIRQNAETNIRSTYTENKTVFRETIVEQKNNANLEFRDINYNIKTRGKENKSLLKGVFGSVDPGSMLAVMGSSGAGKTTLLNVLAGRATAGEISGSITLSGQPFKGFRETDVSLGNKITDPSRPPIFAYVMQDDVHLPALTVQETLEFAAMLRMRIFNRNAPEIKTAVDKVVDMLGLRLVVNNIVGTPEKRNISCGQLRRLSIGVEIVHDPYLIFLDEPTSGLDSYLASTVVEGMKTLARSGIKLIFTFFNLKSS